jgi:hypothetical protein
MAVLSKTFQSIVCDLIGVKVSFLQILKMVSIFSQSLQSLARYVIFDQGQSLDISKLIGIQSNYFQPEICYLTFLNPNSIEIGEIISLIYQLNKFLLFAFIGEIGTTVNNNFVCSIIN